VLAARIACAAIYDALSNCFAFIRNSYAFGVALQGPEK